MLFLNLLTVDPREYSPDGTLVKNSPANAGDIRDMGSVPGLGRSLGEGNGYSFQDSLSGESHGHRGLVSSSPWGHKELDMT